LIIGAVGDKGEGDTAMVREGMVRDRGRLGIMGLGTGVLVAVVLLVVIPALIMGMRGVVAGMSGMGIIMVLLLVMVMAMVGVSAATTIPRDMVQTREEDGEVRIGVEGEMAIRALTAAEVPGSGREDSVRNGKDSKEGNKDKDTREASSNQGGKEGSGNQGSNINNR